jgi:hypothetical protein
MSGYGANALSEFVRETMVWPHQESMAAGGKTELVRLGWQQIHQTAHARHGFKQGKNALVERRQVAVLWGLVRTIASFPAAKFLLPEKLLTRTLMP